MHIVRKLLLALVFVGNPSSFAATEFEGSVPLELAKIFLNILQTGEVSIYSDLPDDFPEFIMPDGFAVLGSVDQTGFMQRVVLETVFNIEETRAAIVSAFTDNGWLEMTSLFSNSSQTGFISLAPVSVAIQLCDDALGNVSVTVREREDTTLVSLSRSQIRLPSGAFRPGCAEQNSRQSLIFGGLGGLNAGIRQYMPRLEIPDEVGSSMPAIGIVSGFSGSNNDVETRFSLPIEWNISEVYQHFAEQISDQDWELDTSWAGSVTAGGTWIRNLEADLELVGMLYILETSENNYELKFRLYSTGSRISVGIRTF